MPGFIDEKHQAVRMNLEHIASSDLADAQNHLSLSPVPGLMNRLYQARRSKSGSFATLDAIRRASSLGRALARSGLLSHRWRS
jgi:hypothetical protein